MLCGNNKILAQEASDSESRRKAVSRCTRRPGRLTTDGQSVLRSRSYFGALLPESLVLSSVLSVTRMNLEEIIA